MALDFRSLMGFFLPILIVGWVLCFCLVVFTYSELEFGSILFMVGLFPVAIVGLWIHVIITNFLLRFSGGVVVHVHASDLDGDELDD